MPSKLKSRSRPRPKPRKSSSKPRKNSIKNYVRGQCAPLGKQSCGSDPNCQWTRNKKTPCRSKRGVRKGDVYQGPLPKQFA